MAVYYYTNTTSSYGYNVTSSNTHTFFEGFFKSDYYSYNYNYNFSAGYNYNKPSNLGDFLVLGSKNDTVKGGLGSDTILGLNGNDTLYGGEGHDLISGGIGNDTLYGDAGNDVLFGDEGHDKLYGGDGNDTLYAEQGTDTLYGNAGNDTLYANGYGNTTMFGGMGADSFTFLSTGTGSLAGDRDTIKDFKADDVINLGFLNGVHDRSDISIAWSKTENAYIVQDNPTAGAEDFYITVHSDHRLTNDDFIF